MRATILGGPHDGEVVEHVGPRLYLPVPAATVARSAVTPLPDTGPAIDAYDARQDLDGRWFYVRETR